MTSLPGIIIVEFLRAMNIGLGNTDTLLGFGGLVERKVFGLDANSISIITQYDLVVDKGFCIALTLNTLCKCTFQFGKPERFADAVGTVQISRSCGHLDCVGEEQQMPG